MPGYSLNDIYGSYGSLDLGTNDGPKDEIDQAFADALFEKDVAKLLDKFGDTDSFDFESFFEGYGSTQDEEMPYGEGARLLFVLEQIEEEYHPIGSPDPFGVHTYADGFDDPFAPEVQEPAYTLELGFTF